MEAETAGEGVGARFEATRVAAICARPEPVRGSLAIVSIVLVALVALAAVESRERQGRAWDADPATYRFSAGPLVSARDAGYFIYRAGAVDRSVDMQPGLFDTPLLSHVIRGAADAREDESLLHAAHRIVPVAAALTAVAVALCFFALGYPIEGALAGLASAVAAASAGRSSVGRIDTDLLNVAFLYGVLALIAVGARSRRHVTVWASAAAAGGLNLLFWWWFDKPGFTAVFAGVLVVTFFAFRRSVRTTVIAVFLFLVFSGPHQLLGVGGQLGAFVSVYLLRSGGPTATEADSGVTGPGLQLPPLEQVVSEAAGAEVSTALQGIAGVGMEGVAVLGGVGLLLFAVARPARLAPLLPPLAFAVLGFFASSRFLMFGVPLFWFGLAFLVRTALDLFAARFAGEVDGRVRLALRTVAIAGLAVLCWQTSPVACDDAEDGPCRPRVVPMPAYTPEVSDGLLRLREVQPDGDAFVALHWDYAHWLRALTGMAPLTAPGFPWHARSHLVARALITSDDEEAVRLLRYGANVTGAELREDVRSADRFHAAVARAAEPPAPLYLMVTEDLLALWPSVWRMGQWDDRGRQREPDGFQRVTCSFQSTRSLACRGFTIDLETGRTSKGSQLAGLLVTEGGRLASSRFFSQGGSRLMVVDRPEQGPLRIFVMPPSISRTLFARLYFTGQSGHGGPRGDRFQLVADGYPHYRVFRVDTGVAQ